MSIAWPTALIQALARRRAVLLIGSGVSANAATAGGDHPPTWGEFLGKAYKGLGRRVGHIQKALSRYSYLEACEYLRGEYNAGWAEVIRDSFVTPQYRHGQIHEAIFDLDCSIVVSLNFDKIYETYAIGASEGTVIVKNYYDADIRQVVSGADRYVIKPHGTVDTMSKLIFTLDDYGKARVEFARFYEVLTALLHTHTFICIGCGLSDPDMQLIFEDYRYKYSESPHYIALAAPTSAAEIALLQKTRGLNVLTYSPRDRHRELPLSLADLGKAVNAARNQIAALQNW